MMKLKNKKTGEIGYPYFQNWKEITCVIVDENAIQIAEYTSLAKLNEEWEDYEEPKEQHYYIEPRGQVIELKFGDDIDDLKEELSEIGNYFDTREEAEKAVEKLKAVKRLKDKGFRFDCWYGGSKDIVFSIPQEIIDRPTAKDLDLLFGGEE